MLFRSTANHLVINTSGNVGIGTTSPSSNLHIKTSVDNSLAQGLVIERSANTDKGYINYNGGGFQFRSTVGDPIVFGETDAEHLRINPDGNVGIGTSSPSEKLTVVGDASISTTGNSTGLRIITSATGEGYLIFGDTADNSMGGMAYSNSTNALMFDSNNAERMRIDSSGNLLVGKTSSSTGVAGARFSANGFSNVTRDGGECFNLNRLTSDGTIIDFRKEIGRASGRERR